MKKRIIILSALITSLFVIYNIWWFVNEPSFGRYSYPYYVFLDSRVRHLPIIEPVRIEPSYRYIHPEGEAPETYQLIYVSSGSIDLLKQAYVSYFNNLGFHLDDSDKQSKKLVYDLKYDHFYVEFNTKNNTDKAVTVSVSLVLK